jgi:hypothetical protein
LSCEGLNSGVEAGLKDWDNTGLGSRKMGDRLSVAPEVELPEGFSDKSLVEFVCRGIRELSIVGKTGGGVGELAARRVAATR